MKRKKERFKYVDVSKNITIFEDNLVQLIDEFEQKTGLAVRGIMVCDPNDVTCPRVDLSFKKK